jgi:hypothetical protein
VRTEALQRDGRIQMMGVIQEQHPDRCRLFMQWKQMGWPVAVDALNRLGFSAVPITFLIDEHGIVRFVNPKPSELEEFLATTYPRPAGLATPPEGAHLEALVPPGDDGTSAEWRDHGDALFLWGGPARLSEAIDAFTRALASSPGDGPLHFRLGTAYRRRYDSPHRRAGDFQKAVDHWTRALEIDPNQYIWRRRLQQYGPRLEKPYPFYGWVDEARRDIRARGDVPVPLVAEPGGAEVAAPEETFATSTTAGKELDPEGRVTRDPGRLIRVEVTLVPPAVAPGGVARAYLVFRPNEGARAHWNNEVTPLSVWVEPPPGWEIDRSDLTTTMPPEAVSTEPREVQFEVKAPPQADSGTTFLPAYALYYVCEDVDGMCLYRRQDIRVPIRLQGP